MGVFLIIDTGQAQEGAEFFGRNFHRTGCGRRTRLWLGESGRGGGMESDVAFHLKHGLVDVSVQHGYRSESFQQAKGLFAVARTPAPLRIDSPERDMGEDYDRRLADRPFRSSASHCIWSAPRAPRPPS